MRTRHYIVTIFATLAVMAILNGCGVQQSPPTQTPPTYTVNDPSDANTTWRSVKPLNFEEEDAIGKCPIPLPPEATDIQYVDFYAGFGGFRRYVRFVAPLAVCQEHTAKLIAKHNTEQTQASQRVEGDPKLLERLYGESLAASARRVESVAQAQWFDTDKIQNGIVWGDNRSHTPVVVIDRDRNVLYYQISD